MRKFIFLFLFASLTYSADLQNPNNEPPPIYLVYSFQATNRIQPRVRGLITQTEFEEHIDSIIDYISNIVYDFARNKYYIEFKYY